LDRKSRPGSRHGLTNDPFTNLDEWIASTDNTPGWEAAPGAVTLPGGLPAAASASPAVAAVAAAGVPPTTRVS